MRKLEDTLQDLFRSTGKISYYMLWKALKMLGHEGFAFADVLLVSDFEFGECTETVQAGILEARQCGTRFYGLSLGKAPNKLCGLFDKMWQV